MHILIVEDEPAIAERLERQIRQLLGSQLDKLKYCDNLDDAQDYIAEQAIDLLFLDLNLHGENGFALLQTLTAESFHTIIVSAYSEKAIDAFSYGVLDFIEKPFTQERLEKALQRLLDVNSRQCYGARFLSIKQAGKIALVEISLIEYIAAAGHYSELFLHDKVYLHDKSIEKLLALLPPNFERIHRSYAINMNKVSHLHIDDGSKYSLEFNNGKRLPIGRSRFPGISAKIKQS